MTIRFAVPSGADVRALTDNLRQSDITEFRCVFPDGDLIVPLEISIGLSDEYFMAYQDGAPLALAGVALNEKGQGVPWMAATDQLSKVPLKVLRSVKRSVDLWSHRYSYLKNYVHKDNIKSQQMLKWLGFTIEPEAELGMHPDFLPFWRT